MNTHLEPPQGFTEYNFADRASIDVLWRYFDWPEDSQPLALVITGPPASGKSRLARDIMRIRPRGHCRALDAWPAERMRIEISKSIEAQWLFFDDARRLAGDALREYLTSTRWEVQQKHREPWVVQLGRFRPRVIVTAPELRLQPSLELLVHRIQLLAPFPVKP